MSEINHVAIIMDGNGRWALKRNKPRNFGHQEGLKNISSLIDFAKKNKIKFLTLFVFSLDNWKRSKREVNFLFNLLEKFLDKNINEFIKKLNEEIEQIKYFDLSSSVDVYNNTTTFVVVHGLKSIEGAKGFGELLKERKSKIVRPYFAISSPNYEILQRHKNLSEYLESQ